MLSSEAFLVSGDHCIEYVILESAVLYLLAEDVERRQRDIFGKIVVSWDAFESRCRLQINFARVQILEVALDDVWLVFRKVNFPVLRMTPAFIESGVKELRSRAKNAFMVSELRGVRPSCDGDSLAGNAKDVNVSHANSKA